MIAGVRRIVEIIICHFRIPSIIADAEDSKNFLDEFFFFEIKILFFRIKIEVKVKIKYFF